jgi:hypothetical protein
MTKGVHLRLKDHIGGSKSSLARISDALSGVGERMLDLIIRRTLKGNRLKVWAEKV